MHLSEVSNNRDNNFNLLRFGAASAVFISHCPPMVGLGIVSYTVLLGYIAVNVFFVISGFLVAKSLIARQNVIQYAIARILRLYPALIVAVLYTVFGVGLFFSELSFSEYLHHEQIWTYTRDNVLQFSTSNQSTLPELTGWGTINAPLWTLPFEIHMYVLLVMVGVLGFVFKGVASKLFWGAYFICVILSAGYYFADYAYSLNGYGLGHDRNYLRFLAMFGSGVGAYFLADKIKLSTKYFLAILVLIGATAQIRILFVCFSYGLLVYVVLYLAYVPGGFLRWFNRLGDYSYGIYIFGYPTQKAVIALLPNLNVVELFLLSFSLTLVIAAISWHLIEKRALTLKRYLISR